MKYTENKFHLITITQTSLSYNDNEKDYFDVKNTDTDVIGTITASYKQSLLFNVSQINQYISCQEMLKSWWNALMNVIFPTRK